MTILVRTTISDLWDTVEPHELTDRLHSMPGHKNIRRMFQDPRFPRATFVTTRRCIAYGDPFDGRANVAHSHSTPGSEFYGLVCIRPESADSEVILAHEYAHLVNGGLDVHGKHWRAIVTALGHPDEARRYFTPRPKRRTATTLWALDPSDRFIPETRYVALVPHHEYPRSWTDGRGWHPDPRLLRDLHDLGHLTDVYASRDVTMRLGRHRTPKDAS